MSMDIILGCLTKLNSTQPDTSDDKVKEVLEKAAMALAGWVIRRDVIGGSFFGGRVTDGLSLPELKVLYYVKNILKMNEEVRMLLLKKELIQVE